VRPRPGWDPSIGDRVEHARVGWRGTVVEPVHDSPWWCVWVKWDEKRHGGSLPREAEVADPRELVLVSAVDLLAEIV
jgi:hypothetical protein